MKKKIIIGTRKSDLALWQANFVKREIEKKNKNVTVELKKIVTKGDKILNKELSKIGDKGLFTKELENALLSEKIDLAVHSLKDLQTELPAGLKLAAVTKRHAPEDVLIARKKRITLEDLPEGATVATGSLRRKSQILSVRPDLKIVNVRGNVPTRINKFLSSKWDAMILARAGVERLKLKKHISSVISTYIILPAVGQGALGIEIKEGNEFIEEILATIHDNDTYVSALAERAFLRTLEGGCQTPVAAYAEVRANGLYLSGFVGSLDGTVTFRKRARGSKYEPEKLGVTLAREMLRAGAKEILDEIYGG
jgi:hydroxymethylbilane synthase